MISYLDQLNSLARKNRIDLAVALKMAGVADSQLSRWRRGIGSPRLDTARRIAAKIVGAKNAASLQVHVPGSRVAGADARVSGTAKRPRRPARNR